ncbi:hypothetical protein [Paenibacillus sp. MBLB4367]|uniref:hypothetical protein n=1 Tax=Paenibacillus sp. MBLB4367 TaxID=3384767 RepID=UPI003907F39A
MARQPDLNEVLSGLSKEKLIRIIIKIAERDEMFKNSLLLEYVKADYSQQIRSCKKLIDSIVKKYVGREGFISYRETYSFAKDMLALLENTNEAQDETFALEISLLVLEEGVAAFQYADDSDGNIGWLVEEALECIREIAGSLDRQDVPARERFFNRLLTMSKSGTFDGWEDFRITLLDICAEFADAVNLREQLKASIDNQIASTGYNEQQKYANESLLKILFQLIQSYESNEEAERFVQKHLHFTFFRERAIEKSMGSKDYRHVIELSEEGERQDKQLPGLVAKWKRMRYEAYKNLSLKQEQGLLAKELLLGGGYGYYHDLESLFDGDKEKFYRSIIAELKKAANWSAQEVYLKLISDKNDLEEMMAYVKANPSAIEEYALRLIADYRAEVEQIYSSHIYHAAEVSSNRKEYQRVCAMLKRYKQIAGQVSQGEIIHRLEAQYNKRPAFLDELTRLK